MCIFSLLIWAYKTDLNPLWSWFSSFKCSGQTENPSNRNVQCTLHFSRITVYDKHVSNCCGCLPTNSVTMATSREIVHEMERWETQIVQKKCHPHSNYSRIEGRESWRPRHLWEVQKDQIFTQKGKQSDSPGTKNVLIEEKAVVEVKVRAALRKRGSGTGAARGRTAAASPSLPQPSPHRSPVGGRHNAEQRLGVTPARPRAGRTKVPEVLEHESARWALRAQSHKNDKVERWCKRDHGLQRVQMKTDHLVATIQVVTLPEPL